MGQRETQHRQRRHSTRSSMAKFSSWGGGRRSMGDAWELHPAQAGGQIQPRVAAR